MYVHQCLRMRVLLFWHRYLCASDDIYMCCYLGDYVLVIVSWSDIICAIHMHTTAPRLSPSSSDECVWLLCAQTPRFAFTSISFTLQEYHPSDTDVQLTPRAIVLGALFAIVNATANMIFAFRYAGGLAQSVGILF